ncbi:hypothetical protein AB0K60_30505 [Thermopolyspora sp. NPDC052614]|uniref:acyl-CoA-like ligand-binding transcription factor n=1 Tax=Thermopolyspora sp. NPDC052614 TaxID=3155682 RepID=UPI0034130F85
MIVEQYTDLGGHDRGVLLLITTRPSLRDTFLDTAAQFEDPLTAVIAERLGDTDQHTARVLSASVAAAVRVALQRWLRPAAVSPATSGLVAPSGRCPNCSGQHSHHSYRRLRQPKDDHGHNG